MSHSSLKLLDPSTERVVLQLNLMSHLGCLLSESLLKSHLLFQLNLQPFQVKPSSKSPLEGIIFLPFIGLNFQLNICYLLLGEPHVMVGAVKILYEALYLLLGLCKLSLAMPSTSHSHLQILILVGKLKLHHSLATLEFIKLTAFSGSYQFGTCKTI
ncbi:uncharacterized protein A4U43_C03F23410 [Asparagus officinalis]|uniref:Uncharacterized protein n=1 Tax=Asparagus officinalis TaxID=4686 RepID=A0A5P1FCC7_ASPOF|nr:uncharacterized protein A4U43_C03F23410 [Asparagus officinalis]